ncbi:hypothetical protein FKM82_018214 [Ascaphus truei]
MNYALDSLQAFGLTVVEEERWCFCFEIVCSFPVLLDIILDMPVTCLAIRGAKFHREKWLVTEAHCLMQTDSLQMWLFSGIFRIHCVHFKCSFTPKQKLMRIVKQDLIMICCIHLP